MVSLDNEAVKSHSEKCQVFHLWMVPHRWIPDRKRLVGLEFGYLIIHGIVAMVTDNGYCMLL